MYTGIIIIIITTLSNATRLSPQLRQPCKKSFVFALKRLSAQRLMT